MASAAALALLAWPQANARELQVVSTFSIISDFARNMGGERIAPTALLGPNGDTHSSPKLEAHPPASVSFMLISSAISHLDIHP